MSHPCLARLGLTASGSSPADARVVEPARATAAHAVSNNPATGQPIAAVTLDSAAALDDAISRAVRAQRQWQLVPAPRRGEIVRRIGNAFREHAQDLGDLVSLEVGKIRAEGLGEVQECIDIADFAVGLSRQLYGLTMPSERPSHRMIEQWHPLGVVGVITAFNFPVAVWAWNAMLAAVCGDAVIWKPSLLAPLTAVAATRIAHRVMREQDLFTPTGGVKPEDIFPLVMGHDAEVGERLVADPRVPLISATGSCRMGKRVGQVVARRLGRCLLELGGNNAIIVMPDADMALTARGVVFGAVGTAGQRCTTTRRLLCVGDSASRLLPKLLDAYRSVRIGDPLEPGTLMGPLINAAAVEQMRHAVQRAVEEGCEVLCGGLPGLERMKSRFSGGGAGAGGGSGHFVEPTIIRVPRRAPGGSAHGGTSVPSGHMSSASGGTGVPPVPFVPSIAREETFAPILYVFECDSLEQAIAMQNDVPQGLSSAIFTDSVRSAERFLSPAGSDCGIANVNLGTSGAEIGGAFGGEKDTGGGRESGSDSWKAYMRRQTCTINYGNDLPLAQGIRFE